jgi:hypothetical protein
VRWEEENERHYLQAIAPLQNKIGTLLMSPVIRNIVGQTHSTFSLERGKIIIANLDRALIGDTTARLLGGLLISRAKGHVYINDLGFFATDHFASLLKQERFTVACRFLAELKPKLNPELEQAVLSIENKVVLKTNRTDAEKLAFYVGVMNPSVLTDLDPAEAKTTTDLIRPKAPKSLRRLPAIRKRSRACHTRPRFKVERNIQAFLNTATSG